MATAIVVTGAGRVTVKGEGSAAPPQHTTVRSTMEAHAPSTPTDTDATRDASPTSVGVRLHGMIAGSSGAPLFSNWAIEQRSSTFVPSSPSWFEPQQSDLPSVVTP